MRIKSTTGWCDPDVRSFSGLVDVRRMIAGLDYLTELTMIGIST